VKLILDFCNFLLDTLESAPVDQDIDAGVDVGDGLTLAQFGALDVITQFYDYG
jgi:hypothetical protein